MDKPPQIVVIDGYTLSHGDLTWNALESLGQCTVFDRSTEAEVLSRSADADIILTNKVKFSGDTINKLPQLKYIGVTATGTNVVDLSAAREHDIIVTNVPSYGTDSVAQLTIAHLLNLVQRVGHHADAVRAGRWSKAPDWCFWDTPLIELKGLTMGILGFGEIGRAVAKLADAFGMPVIATTRSSCKHPDYVQMVDVDELFRTADVLSLHCPLTPETKGLVNAERLAEMKRSAFLINTSRGQLIDEQALAEALANGEIAGAGLDVLSTEPPPVDHPLVAAPNCFITPHLAWATLSARKRLMQVLVENVAAFLAGKPQNVVN
ncbi:D-2-hydroxyacid dehydrogenase [Bythopirellula polymerisocia]|nr:D-2-hydroxyacid dehydrogenase [Bythopirellula polymerisocia]